MENTSFIALSRQGALQREIGIIANNLANLNTTGFKAKKMMFVEHIVKTKGGDRISGDRLAFVRDIATMRVTTQGNLEKTGNPLDLAIRGDGFFAIQTKNGERYTRDGHFRLDTQGQLVTQKGDPVLSDGGQPFFFGPEDKKISVSRDGTVSTENGEVGRVRLVQFKNNQAMHEIGNGLLSTDQTPTTVDNPDVVQNMLEDSNVQPITEMARMIAVQRAYDNVKKFIDREDQRIRTMIRDVTRTA